MIDLFNSAIKNERNEEYSFFLSGDLSQMSNQRSFLSKHGFSIKQNNVYPCLRQKDIKNALTLIWQYKSDGWWHYCDDYIKHNICTKEEFNNYLHRTT